MFCGIVIRSLYNIIIGSFQKEKHMLILAKYEGYPSVGIHKQLKQKLLLSKEVKGRKVNLVSTRFTSLYIWKYPIIRAVTVSPYKYAL